MSGQFEINKYPGLTFGDSGVVAVLGVQTALLRQHFDPFPQPEWTRKAARLLNVLPVNMRVGIADRISSSIGNSKDDFEKFDTEGAATWVTDGYPAEKYPGVVIGAPGLSATFLSVLLGAPFLPQPLLLNARRDFKPDNAQGYLDAGTEITEPLLANNPSIEATIHFDPVHDRFLIKRVVFVRMKFLELPKAYRRFIENRLLPGSPVILLDCGYKWLRAKVSDRLYFQLGGLGGISAMEYIEETEALRTYRKKWGAPDDATWKIDGEYVEGPESEWGSSGTMLDDAEKVAAEHGQIPVRVRHNHPIELSSKVFKLHRRMWQGTERPDSIYVGVFTHTEPRFPMVTGCLPLWLPFITDENVAQADEIIGEWRDNCAILKSDGTAYMTLHPSFCAPPDIVYLPTWRELLKKYFREVKILGIDPGRYPFDLGSYVTMYPAIIKAAKEAAYPGTPFRRPTPIELQATLLNEK